MRIKLSKLILLLWSTIILIIVGLSYLLIAGYFNFPSPHPSPSPPATQHPPATPSPLPPTIALLPSTPTPTPSPIPPTPTPTLPQPQVIGFSVAGRPLNVYQFGNGPIEKMIVAGIHGGYEWNTVALADELIEYLETHPEVIPADHTLYILRAFNIDGYERSSWRSGRANENNVDLNRNFPSNWQPDWPRAGCWNYLPIEGGNSAASEPETKALISFINSHDLTALISYHSAALGIFAGGQPPDAGSLSLAESVAAVSEYPYPPIATGCVFTGQFVDWVSDQGIAGIDIELTNHQDTDFLINLAILSVFLDWSPPE
jgi:hypothetical protein